MSWQFKLRLKEIKETFKQHFNLYKALYQDPRTPKISKVLLWLAISYTLLGFDLIPDFIPVIGLLDDVIIIPSLIFLAIKFIPKNLYEEYRQQFFKVD